MITSLREWLQGIFCAALLVTLIRQLLPNGRLRKLLSMTGGLLLILTALRPLGLGAEWDFCDYEQAVAERRQELEAQRQEELSVIIAEEAEAYLWEVGEELGLRRVTVEVREVDGVLLPWSAQLDAPRSDALSARLAELGIPAERQVYHED